MARDEHAPCGEKESEMNEEKMTVLRMLAEGKINAEEANNLLDALEKGAG